MDYLFAIMHHLLNIIQKNVKKRLILFPENAANHYWISSRSQRSWISNKKFSSNLLLGDCKNWANIHVIKNVDKKLKYSIDFSGDSEKNNTTWLDKIQQAKILKALSMVVKLTKNFIITKLRNSSRVARELRSKYDSL